MNDLLLEVLAAVETGTAVFPPTVPTVELRAERRMTLDDAPRIRGFLQYVIEELEIQLTVVGGGVGCTRIIVTVECLNVDEAARLLNELFSSEQFSKAAVEVGFNALLRCEPYAHKTLASGRLLGKLPQDGIPVFISYAHEDENHRVELEKHISALIQQKLLQTWHDRRVTGGKEWAREIDSALESARMILLLVSSDFMASEYCTNIELPYALRRHQEGKARSIPVIVRPVDLEETSLATLQALPSDGKPITLWADRDQAWMDVAKHLRRIVRELRQA